MTRPDARLLECDTQLARLAPGLQADDLAEVERTRRALNAWLDNRLVAMGEEDKCASSQHSASVPS